MSTGSPQIDASSKQWKQSVAVYRETEDRIEQFRQLAENNRAQLVQLENDDPQQFRTLCEALQRHEQELKHNRLFGMFPDDDYHVWNPKFQQWLNLKRDNYPKHIAFINATKDNQFTAMFAGNRVGKTQVGAFMTACHLTGIYPDWWKGHRFSGPVQAWAVVENYEATKDPVQKMLFGRFFSGQQKNVTGDGMVPKSLIDRKSLHGRGGAAPDVLASVNVKHLNSSGPENYSQLHFKSFEQSDQSFVGRAVDWIWIDEGPSYQIFKECCMRIVSEKGRLILTWTPLDGYTPVVQEFIPKGVSLSKVFDSNQDVVKITERSALVMAGWKDIPHIPETEKEQLIQHFRDTGQSEEMIDARIKGIPHVGAGKVYRLPRSDLEYDPVNMGRFPAHWKHVCGLDPGWRVTAAIWGCYDPDNEVLYLYNEHYGQEKEVVHNAGALKARGKWIPVVMDPAGQQRQQGDGKTMMELYANQEIDVSAAKNAVEAGIEAVKKMMYEGRLKVSKHLQNFWKEYDLYSRKLDEEEDIAKILRRENHLMDAMRYLVVSGIEVARSQSETVTKGRLKPYKPFRPGEV